VNELFAWLRAQLDDDERVIRGSGDLGWLTFRQPDGSMDHTEAASYGGGVWIVASEERTGYASAEIVSCESERLAEVEAKRRILAALDADIMHANPWDGCGDNCEIKAIEWAVRMLAQPYAGRPGWHEEWRA
jgi:hypothetical protein